MNAEIRVGKISSIDYPAGMVRVVYPDMDDDVTRPIPLLSSEYAMPPVGALVAVVHLSNGAEAGVVLGRPWSGKLTPPEGFEGLYRKDFDLEPGRCYFRYDASGPESLFHNEGDTEITISGKLTLKVGGCAVEIDGSSVTVNAPSEVSLSAPTLKLNGTTVQISGAALNITGGAGDCAIGGKSLAAHTHTSAAPGSPTTPPL